MRRHWHGLGGRRDRRQDERRERGGDCGFRHRETLPLGADAQSAFDSRRMASFLTRGQGVERHRSAANKPRGGRRRPLPPHQPAGSRRERDDRQRRADLEIGPEADRHALRAGAFGDDEIGDRSEQGEIAGQRRAHRDHEPGALGIRESRNERPQRQHRRHVAHDVGEHGGEQRQPPDHIEAERLRHRDAIGRQQRFFRAGDDDEHAGEENEQRPVELAVDAVRLDLAREQQERAGNEWPPSQGRRRRRRRSPAQRK